MVARNRKKMFYFQELFFLYAVFWCCFREEKKFNRHKSLQSLVKNVLPNPDFCNPSPSLQSRFLTPCTTTFLNNAYLPCSRKYTRNSETCRVDLLIAEKSAEYEESSPFHLGIGLVHIRVMVSFATSKRGPKDNFGWQTEGRRFR